MKNTSSMKTQYHNPNFYIFISSFKYSITCKYIHIYLYTYKILDVILQRTIVTFIFCIINCV